MKKFLVVLAISLLCCVSCGGDDNGSDPEGPSGSSPQIADLECNPSSVPVGEGSGATTVACAVSFQDADMDLETILVRFRKDCGRGSWQEVPKNVVDQTAGKIQGDIHFDFIAETDCPASNYPYEITAKDSKKHVSNVLTLQFVLEDEEPTS